MSLWILFSIYSVLIVISSLIGGAIPRWVKLSHRRVEFGVSFVAGVMLGVAVLHLVPHSLHTAASIDHVMLSLLAGFLVMFFAERFLCFHHHEVAGEEGEYAHECQHHHAPASGHSPAWGGAFVGLTIHSLVSGLALGASIVSEASHHGQGIAAGFGTFLVIFLHKPFDSLTIGSLMIFGEQTPAKAQLINVLFALVVPLGAFFFMMGGRSVNPESVFVGCALAFAAGAFLCISMSDLLPELQFHSHDRFGLSAALVGGLLLAWAMGFVENSH